MKRKMLLLLGAMALVAIQGGNAQAVEYTVDTLIGAIDSTSSGQAYEETQLETFCSPCDVTLLANVDTSLFGTDESGDRYINVAPNEPGYFILKFGQNTGAIDMYFFENINELTKLVWNDSQLTNSGTSAFSLSHYAITGGTPSVPEPMSLLLLGAGLAGVGIWRRKVMKG